MRVGLCWTPARKLRNSDRAARDSMITGLGAVLTGEAEFLAAYRVADEGTRQQQRAQFRTRPRTTES